VFFYVVQIYKLTNIIQFNSWAWVLSPYVDEHRTESYSSQKFLLLAIVNVLQ
jgi:hypothetical protein